MNDERDQIKSDEALKFFPYKCSKGKITIGYGRNLDGNPLTNDEVMTLLLNRPEISVNNTPLQEVRKLLLKSFYEKGIALHEAEWLFENSYKEAERGLTNTFPWYKDAPLEVRNILINMTFQMGLSTMKGFYTTMPMIGRGEYALAAENLKLSKWYKDTPNRAKRLIKRLSEVK